MICPGLYRNIFRQLALGTCLLFVSLQAGFSQPPETFVQALSRHGVALTKPALIDALRNPDKEVRGLAAAELAELKATDSLPEIMRAAEIEQDTVTKVNIAAAATWLGSTDALNMLKRVCGDTTLPPYARQNAARNVFDRSDHACFSAVADMMLPSEDPDTRIGALYLLSQLHDRTEDESNRVLQLLAASLNDPDLRIRLKTCQGLRWLNNPEAITPLRNALATEREEIVRAEMQSTLDSLVNKSRK
jgi:HEAT repeat protein